MKREVGSGKRRRKRARQAWDKEENNEAERKRRRTGRDNRNESTSRPGNETKSQTKAKINGFWNKDVWSLDLKHDQWICNHFCIYGRVCSNLQHLTNTNYHRIYKSRQINTKKHLLLRPQTGEGGIKIPQIPQQDFFCSFMYQLSS